MGCGVRCWGAACLHVSPDDQPAALAADSSLSLQPLRRLAHQILNRSQVRRRSEQLGAGDRSDGFQFKLVIVAMQPHAAATHPAAHRIAIVVVTGDCHHRAAAHAVAHRHAFVAVQYDVLQRALLCEGGEGVYQLLVELAARAFLQLLNRVVDGHAFAVGAGAGHGVEGIGHADDAGRQGDGFSRQLVGVAAAVDAFVVVADAVVGQFGQGVFADQIGTDGGVGFDYCIFVLGKDLPFVENGVGHPHLAQVVQKTAEGDLHYLVVGKPQLLGQQFGKLRNPPQVAAGVGVPRLHYRPHVQH